MRFFSLALAAATIALCASAVAADAYPHRQLKIIVPFGSSSGLDPVARTIGERLASQMGISVIVENREGAGGQIGVMAAVAAPPDGGTIVLVVHPPYAAAPYLKKKAPYDPRVDLTPIAKVINTPLMLIASNASGIKSVAEMVDRARENPGKLSYGSSGTGTASHLKMEQIKMLLGNLDIKFVPYRSTGQQMTDTIGGQIDLSLPSLSGGFSQVKSGLVRALAVGSAKRSPLLPDVPTFAEAAGKPGVEAVVWYGFMGPKGLPAPIINRLSSEIEKALQSPEMTKLIDTLGAERAYQNPAEFAALVRDSAEEARVLQEVLKLPLQD